MGTTFKIIMQINLQFTFHKKTFVIAFLHSKVQKPKIKFENINFY